MAARYRLDPARSRFMVQAFAAGMLSAFAHSPTFSARDFAGELTFEGGEVDGMALTLSVNADSLDLLDKVRAADRREIEDRMRREVLETSAHPAIAFQAAGIAAEPIARALYRLQIAGLLSLHGVTRPHPVVAELRVFDDAVSMSGASPLRLSDYRIRPVTALGGAIRLKDELKVSFELAAFPEGP